MSKKKSNLEKLNILLCVSGGIAAYKSVDLARRLAVAGASVKTVMTENACRLVGPKSFEAVTESTVFTDLWGVSEEHKISHIALVDWADMVIVAPATADIIGKIANGICDDLLSTTLCTCWAKPTLLAPAMNSKMWDNPAVRRNVETLKEMGFELTGPEEGRLACGTEGMGRMSEAGDILEAAEHIASRIRRSRR